MISVIIRTYNSEKTIKRAIESALSQSLDKNKYEIIVVDDGSTDGTLDIVKSYPVRVIEQGHKGAPEASNEGIRESNGEYVTLLDSDDEFVPEMLQTMIEAFQEDPSIDFAYCDYIERKGGQESVISLKDNIFDTIATAIVFKKSLFEEVGYYDSTVFFGEYDLLIRLLNADKTGKHVPVPLYVYIRTEGSLTFDQNSVEKGIQQLKKRYGQIAEKVRKY